MNQEIKSFLSFCLITALVVAGVAVVVAAVSVLEFALRLI